MRHFWPSVDGVCCPLAISRVRKQTTRVCLSPSYNDSPMTSEEQAVLDVSAKLLKAIDAGDWKGYAALCDDSLTCFEPEARGNLVAGMPFHKLISISRAAAGRASRRSHRHTFASWAKPPSCATSASSRSWMRIRTRSRPRSKRPACGRSRGRRGSTSTSTGLPAEHAVGRCWMNGVPAVATAGLSACRGESHAAIRSRAVSCRPPVDSCSGR